MIAARVGCGCREFGGAFDRRCVERPTDERARRVGGFQDTRRQARDYGDRDDQAEKHGAANGDGDVPEELAHLLLDEDDGHEDGNGRKGARQDRSPHFLGAIGRGNKLAYEKRVEEADAEVAAQKLAFESAKKEFDEFYAPSNP